MYIARYYPHTRELTLNGRRVATRNADRHWTIDYDVLIDVIAANEHWFGTDYRRARHHTMFECVTSMARLAPMQPEVLVETMNKVAARL